MEGHGRELGEDRVAAIFFKGGSHLPSEELRLTVSREPHAPWRCVSKVRICKT